LSFKVPRHYLSNTTEGGLFPAGIEPATLPFHFHCIEGGFESTEVYLCV
jgi:hypothetical protein